MVEFNDLPQDIKIYIFNIVNHKNKSYNGISCNHPKCYIGEYNKCIFKIFKKLNNRII
jgi:hypothetical protein